MKKLIATDFDGTLCRGGTVSDADRAAIDAWRAEGRLFGVVTGRGTDFLDTIRELGVGFDYLSVYNGSLLITPEGTVVKEYLIGREDFCRLEAFFDRLPGLRFHDRASEKAFYRHYYATFADQSLALEAAARVNGLYGDRVTAFVNGEHVNIGRKGSSKTQGVFDALAFFGLPDDAAAVFGDDYNDLDMIVTHRGWAMSSGRPEVIAAAEHVCGSIAEAVETLMA